MVSEVEFPWFRGPRLVRRHRVCWASLPFDNSDEPVTSSSCCSRCPQAMAHYLSPHGDPNNLAQHGMQPGIPMDPNQPPPPPPQHFQSQQPPPLPNIPRKRKKVDPESGEPATPAEPRRLRRSHEACARCRSKKIKASPAGRHRRQIPVASPISLRLTHLSFSPHRL